MSKSPRSWVLYSIVIVVIIIIVAVLASQFLLSGESAGGLF
jgi:t-SNARE complex subunit (syntaxin)